MFRKKPQPTTHEQQQAQQIAQLTASRRAIADAYEVERARIERDLHDGPQQRMVSIAMTLGMAKEAIHRDPDAAAQLVDEAHRSAKEAIVEMRHVARGIVPPILADRGLEAALPALAARAAVPVSVEVRDVGRLDPTTEAIAYFVVSEALTNVAKHSGAQHDEVVVTADGEQLTATVTDDGLTVQYSKDQIKDAPRVDAGEHLSVEQEQELYRYYGVDGQGAEGVATDRTDRTDVAAGTAAAGTAGAAGHVGDRDERAVADRDIADRDTADRDIADRDADATMVRHEEHLNVGTERQETGRARLRKYVDEEEQTVSVPVETESAHVVRRPVDGEVVSDGKAFQEQEVEMDLESERPVVSKETVAVEEVGLEKETHTENVQVSDSVRSERIEVEGDDDLRDGDRRA